MPMPALTDGEKGKFANRGQGFVNGRLLQSTLRQMQGHFTDHRTWVGLALAALVLGLAGPFGTFALTPVTLRFAYWAAVAVLTYATGFFFGALLETADPLRRHWLRVPVYGLAVSLPVTLVVVIIQLTTFGIDEADVPGVAELWLYCAITSIAIFGAEAVLLGARDTAAPPAAAPPPPPLLDRLPPAQRGRLSHLSMQDHYVDVVTDRGRTLVLLRLADAMRETEGVAGVQIHRSHWVARDAVSRAVRRDGKVLLEMRDGTLLPVSRSFLPAVKAAGLLG